MAEQNLEQSIFVQAIGLTTPSDRAAYLDETCRDDPELRAELDALLAAHDRLGGVRMSPDATAAFTPPTEAMGTVIGQYKLVEQIGEGGMGTVWMAQQIEPVKRLVAVKLIKAGMDSKQVVARFEAERRALALMDHPNIARVLDAGATVAGRPYFVMDLVKGLPLTRYCDEHCLTLRQRLELFVPVCQAVQHAHQKGIIHRDLKPSNVLVTRYDGHPVPKVIDFGVAKAAGQSLTEKTLVTGFGHIVGTLEYMSPEQAEVNQLDIDTRSDIYSLGVLLYELLAGSPPFSREDVEKAGMLEALRMIREQELSKPSTKLSTADGLPTLAANRGTEPTKLAKLVRGELDWIVMKALEKDRNRRYETANSFAIDVQRYLANEPVQACPPSAAYRVRKFARRHRGPVVAVSCILFALVAGIVGTTTGMLWAVRERDQKGQALAAETTEREAKEQALDAEKKARGKAIEALRTLTDEIVENLIARGSTLTEENQAFLRKVIEHCDDLAAITTDDAESRAIRAESRFRVGLMRERLGELDDAEAAFAAALAIYQQLAADFPQRPEFCNGVARSHTSLGNLCDATGRPAQAAAAYAAAIAIQSQLTQDFPAEPDFRLHLAESHSNQGLFFKKTGRLNEAERSFDSALAIFGPLADEFPALPKARWELALCRENRAILLGTMGRLKDAVAAYADVITVEKQLVEDFPGRPDYRQKLAIAHVGLGNLHWMAGSSQDADSAWSTAIAMQKQLVADFPARPEYRVELAHSHNNLGLVFATKGQLQEAEAALRAALEIRQHLMVDFPTRPDIRQQLAANYGNLGCVVESLGRPREADESFAAALALFRQLVAEFRNQPDVRNGLACALGNQGALRLKTRDFQAAKAYFDEAVPHHEAALRSNPGELTYRHFYRNALAALIPTNVGLGDESAAKQAAEKLCDCGWDPPADAFAAAVGLASCIPIIRENKNAPVEDRERQAARYGDEAMKTLRDAVAKGLKDLARVKADKDLDPLRGRADFNQLLASLELSKQM